MLCINTCVLPWLFLVWFGWLKHPILLVLSPAFGPTVHLLVGAVSTWGRHQGSSASLGPHHTSTRPPASVCYNLCQSAASQLQFIPTPLSFTQPPHPQRKHNGALQEVNRRKEKRNGRETFSVSILWKNSEAWACTKWLPEALWIQGEKTAPHETQKAVHH